MTILNKEQGREEANHYCSIAYSFEQYRAGNCPLNDVEAAVSATIAFLEAEKKWVAEDAFEAGYKRRLFDVWVKITNSPWLDREPPPSKEQFLSRFNSEQPENGQLNKQ